jgi:hypothetical protein
MPVTLATTLPRATDVGVETAGVIQSVGATRTLAQGESGSLCLFDAADGVVYTLPNAALGLTFEFLVTVTITSNAAKFITQAGQFLIGGVGTFAEDVAVGGDHFTANGTTIRSSSSNGTTTGGVAGQYMKVVAISATQWAVSGFQAGTAGTMATSFATS